MNKRLTQKQLSKYLNHLVSAEVYIGGSSSVCLIMPFPEKAPPLKTYFYWDTGPSKCYATFMIGDQPLVSGQARILHDYGIPDPDDDDYYTRVDLHYLTTYYPAAPMDPPAPDNDGGFWGWLAPNGDYYLSHYRDHDSTARAIWAVLYNEVLAGYKAREKLLIDWLQLNELAGPGLFGRVTDHDMTRAQEATIRKIASIKGVDPRAYIKARKLEA